jgi:putative ABC transport system permease protein
MALGAPSAAVLGLVVRDGLSLALAGAATGVAGALALSRLLRAVLHDVSPTDPAAFAGAVVVLLAAAAAATLLPALRAARVDPVSTLRET